MVGKLVKEPAPKKKKRRKKGPKNKGGRKPYEPTAEVRGQVNALAAFGLAERQIATHLSISRPTLVKYYGEELNKARINVMGRAMSGLVKALNKDEPWAIKFVLCTLGKTYGWTQHLEDDDNDIMGIPAHLSSLTDGQLLQFLDRLQVAIAAREAAASQPQSPPALIGSGRGESGG